MAYKTVTEMRAGVGAIAAEIEKFGGVLEELRRVAQQFGLTDLATELQVVAQDLMQDVERMRRM